MSPNSIQRVWINPWKYYTFTAGMDQPQRDALMESVLEDARAGNEEKLKQLGFVSLDNPYLEWRRERHGKKQRRAV
jgi:hypothetical protein